MSYPADLKYTKDHEWIRFSESTAEIGITDYAQQQLGDVVYVELPEIGRTLAAGEVFGSVESVKAVSELFSPATGEVVAVNETLKEHPETVNSTPHDAWMIRIRVAGSGASDGLLDSAQYESLVG
jgi:glycine cleavage system H protein